MSLCMNIVYNRISIVHDKNNAISLARPYELTFSFVCVVCATIGPTFVLVRMDL